MISILKFMIYLFSILAAILTAFTSMSYSKIAREKFKILKVSDGKKHIFLIVIIIFICLFFSSKYWLDLVLNKSKDCPKDILEIAQLADRALWERATNCGDRAIYNNLIKCYEKTENSELKKQIKRIKDDYKTSILVPRVDAITAVCQYGGMRGDKCIAKEPTEGFFAQNVVDHLDVKKYSRCTSRARAACILRNIKTADKKEDVNMSKVVKTLIFIMKNDSSLLVSKLALDRYSQFTGFSPSGIFDFRGAIDHSDERKKQGEPLLLPKYKFKPD